MEINLLSGCREQPEDYVAAAKFRM